MQDNFKSFLMIDYDMPEFIKKLQERIPESELYSDPEDNQREYGLEKETHVTVVPCLSDSVDLDELKKMLKKIDKYNLLLSNISLFQNEKYDVLKCDAHSDILLNTNSDIRSKFETRSDYNNYCPHVTIAYLKPGMGEKYIQQILTPLVVLKPKQFHFSCIGEDGNDQNIVFVS